MGIKTGLGTWLRRKDGRYYFVFPARDKEGMLRIGIDIGDNPGGTFTS